jgi:hypothetical protein
VIGLFSSWLFAFAVTQAIEAPIYRGALGGRWGVALIASLLTHPLVFSATAAAPLEWFWWVLLAAEAFAVLAEALYLRRAGLKDALLWSITANGASFAAGSLLEVGRALLFGA